jgi:F-type H+-transporting ATPase subunit delta
MDNSLISVRYAKALFLLSKEKGIVDNVYNDMLIISEQCKNTPNFSALLHSPVFKPADKKKAFNTIFGKYLNPISLKFLGLVVDNRREVLLSDISRNYIDAYKKQIGLKTAFLYTALKLDDDYVNEVRILLEKELNARVELHVSVRDHLIGGFILMVDGKMMDASIFNKLKVFKNKLLS